MRDRYNDLMAHPEELEAIMQAGAAKARVHAQELIERLRQAVGLRSFVDIAQSQTHQKAPTKAVLPVFKQYREADGLFYFSLTLNNQKLFTSKGMSTGKEAGQWVKTLKTNPEKAHEAPILLDAHTDINEVIKVLSVFATES